MEVIFRRLVCKKPLSEYVACLYIDSSSCGVIFKETATSHYMLIILNKKWNVEKFYSIDIEVLKEHFSNLMNMPIKKEEEVDALLDCVIFTDLASQVGITVTVT